jgi:hypothetical protein
MPLSAQDKVFREMLRGAGEQSGTQVFEALKDRPADAAVWLEPGSVLVCEGTALDDWAHGLLPREEDVYDASALANAACVSMDAVAKRASDLVHVQGRLAAKEGSRAATPVGVDDRLPISNAAAAAAAAVAASAPLLPGALPRAQEPLLPVVQKVPVAGSNTKSLIVVPRTERVSVVMWTPDAASSPDG